MLIKYRFAAWPPALASTRAIYVGYITLSHPLTLWNKVEEVAQFSRYLYQNWCASWPTPNSHVGSSEISSFCLCVCQFTEKMKEIVFCPLQSLIICGHIDLGLSHRLAPMK